MSLQLLIWEIKHSKIQLGIVTTHTDFSSFHSRLILSLKIFVRFATISSVRWWCNLAISVSILLKWKIASKVSLPILFYERIMNWIHATHYWVRFIVWIMMYFCWVSFSAWRYSVKSTKKFFVSDSSIESNFKSSKMSSMIGASDGLKK